MSFVYFANDSKQTFTYDSVSTNLEYGPRGLMAKIIPFIKP